MAVVLIGLKVVGGILWSLMMNLLFGQDKSDFEWNCLRLDRLHSLAFLRRFIVRYSAIYAICFLSILLSIGGCGEFKGATGPAGPRLLGNLVGFVYLYDVNGAKAIDNSGITVKAEGTSIATTTSTDGYFSLAGLSTGTYTYSFSKTGYGTRKVIQAQFVGGGDVYYGETTLYEIPAFTVTNLSDSISSGYVYFKGVLSGTLPTSTVHLSFFFGTTSTVSSNPSNYTFSLGFSLPAADTISFGLAKSSFYNYSITSGQTVFAVVYASDYGSTSYVDLSTGNSIHSGINPTPSNTISFIVP